MKKILIIGGLLVVAISVVGLFTNFKKKEVLQNGKEVDVAVVSVSERAGKWLNSSFVFQYNGKRYSKGVDGKLERVKNFRSIKLKTNSDNSVFVYPDENLNSEFITALFLFTLGLVIIYKGSRCK